MLRRRIVVGVALALFAHGCSREPPEAHARLEHLASRSDTLASGPGSELELSVDESGDVAPGDASGWEARGHPCTSDCSGREAGYRWAEERGLDDANDCGGESASFVEGCRAFVEEQRNIGGDSDANESEGWRSDDDESP